MGNVKVGITLPGFGEDERALTTHARHAEEVGLESVWIGDHLIPIQPYLDSTLVLAAAAAVTSRIRLGLGVMVLALRPVAWAAKQIASLQHLSGGRLLLGVGAGADLHGEAAWRAVGVPYRQRGHRTDAALEVLPMLVRGEPTSLNGEVVTLAPGAPMPPVLIGGGPATLRRAARFGDEWYPVFSSPSALVAAAATLAELAADLGRPTPALTVGVGVGLGRLPSAVIDKHVGSLIDYGMTDEEARAAVVTGSPAQAAERFRELAGIGVHRIVGMPFAGDRLGQSELLGEAARLANA